MAHPPPSAGGTALPASIWGLGLVSLLMDVSSEMIHGLLPVFLVGTLGASALALGLIEGVAEATALVVKVFSGALSDWWGRRKPLALLGYGLGALSKPLFALATGAGLVFGARVVDRIGKGIRGAPRDALVAELAPPALRGAAFGLRQSLDTVGAFLGPLLAIALLAAWGGDVRAVFWVAVVPGLAAVAVLALMVHEPPRPVGAQVRVNPIRRESLRTLPRAYWTVVGFGAVFTLARFSEAFLILRVVGDGAASAPQASDALWAPLVLIVMNVVYALAAYPMGRLSDRVDRRRLLAAGIVVLIAADALLAAAALTGSWAAWTGVALWGLHLALTQGQLAALVADTAPPELLGTAYGVFNLAGGVALLLASAIAGALWQWAGPAWTFGAGAGAAAVALAWMARVRAAAG